jgi:enoyl-CoA hydratase/carnithine racemase
MSAQPESGAAAGAAAHAAEAAAHAGEPGVVTDGIGVADHERVRTLTLCRPSRLNAFTSASYSALAAALTAAASDHEVRVVELVGAGRAFSSGVDLDALAAAADPAEYRDSFALLLQELSAFPKPLLAGVHGAAVGFGMTILLHADVVVVADDARLRAPFAALGMAPEAASSVLLPALVGPQQAAELLFTGRWITAEEAVKLGLAARRCAPGDLRRELRALARQIAVHPPEAIAAAKRLLRSGRAEQAEAALGREDMESSALRAGRGPLGRSSPG